MSVTGKMTGEDIKRIAEKRARTQIKNSDALTAINEGLDRIGDMAITVEMAHVEEAEAGTWIRLPEDMTFLIGVRDSDGSVYRDYEYLHGGILFKDPGDYMVIGHKMPKQLESLDQWPDVHRLFQRCLVTYLVSWVMLRDDQQSPEGLKKEQQFEADVQRAHLTLKRMNSPSKIKVYRRA